MDAPCVSFVFRAQANALTIPLADPGDHIGLGVLNPEQARMVADALRELSRSCTTLHDAGAIGMMAGELMHVANRT